METERLIIDRIKENDKEDYFYNISNDKKVLETFICKYVEKIEDFDFSPYLDNKTLFAIRLKETKKLIGIILYFDYENEKCEIGYGIGSTYWNKGYVTEAVKAFIDYCFKKLDVKKVYASFFSGNIASKRVMEKNGMVFDHLSLKELTYLGVERDLIYYSIKKELDIKSFSKYYDVLYLNDDDVMMIYDLCYNNDLYYKYYPPMVSIDSIKEDMNALPKEKAVNDKYYVGYFDDNELIAILDLIDKYNSNDKVLIGFFMVDKKYQNNGIGSKIIEELCDYIRSMNRNVIRLGFAFRNEKARSFWKKNDFLEIENNKILNKKEYDNIIILEKDIRK